MQRSQRGEAAMRREPMVTGSIAPLQRGAADFRGRPTRTTRFETVQEGIDSGLEVMTLRTVQLPNGRRIKFLTKPDPETMSQLLNERQ
jgi:hypothetical protein